MDDYYAIVVSEFNDCITTKLLEGAMTEYASLGIAADHIKVFRVPGAIEIPLTAQLLAKTNQYAAIVCLGAVIRGETSHYDYVCQQVSQGCQTVMLQHNVPVIFGVLTTENEEQALARVGGEEGHKGREAVQAAIQMVKVKKDIQAINQLM